MRISQWILSTVVLFSCALARAQSDPYADAEKYKLDQPRAAVMAIEAQIRQANADQLRAIEGKLIKIVQSPAATPDARGWACRQLRQVGSDACVDAVAALLADKDVALQARWALQSIAGEKAGAALRSAIAKTQGELKAGVIQTIGARGDRAAVAGIAALLADADAGVVEASIFALGRIGGADALAALVAAKAPEALSKEHQHAIVIAAESAAREGKTAEAFSAIKGVFDKAADSAIRGAALRSMVLVDKTRAAPVLAAMIHGNDPGMSLAAIRLAFELGGPESTGPILADFARLPGEMQALVLSLANDKSAARAALASLRSGDESVRLAALAALGRVGDGAAVAPLLSAAAQGKGAEQAAARKSLRTIRGGDVDTALAAGAKDGQPAARVEAISALASRNAVAQATLLIALAQDSDKTVRAEALAALAAIGDSKSIAELLNLLAKPTEEQSAIENALSAIALRSPAKEQDAAAIAAKFAGAPAEVRGSLLRVLARVPAAPSLAALRAGLKDPEAAVQDAAIRGLADWPESSAAADLAAIAGETKNPAHKVLAIRGLVRLARLDKVPAEESVKLLSEAMRLSTRVEEKRLVLSGLADVKSPAAIDVAAPCLSEAALEVEAASAIVRIARAIRSTHRDASAAGIRKVIETVKSPAARKIAEGSRILVGELENIAPTGKATCPNNLKTDGQSGPPQAAIDGKPDTYFDQQDNQKLYRLLVTLPGPETICAVTVTGYDHHKYSPKTFEIVCDGKTVKKVDNAQYDDNYLIVALDDTTCTTVELKITAYYGASPGIRELGIYRKRK